MRLRSRARAEAILAKYDILEMTIKCHVQRRFIGQLLENFKPRTIEEADSIYQRHIDKLTDSIVVLKDLADDMALQRVSSLGSDTHLIMWIDEATEGHRTLENLSRYAADLPSAYCDNFSLVPRAMFKYAPKWCESAITEISKLVSGNCPLCLVRNCNRSCPRCNQEVCNECVLNSNSRCSYCRQEMKYE